MSDEINTLVNQLKIARQFYYDGKPIMTDLQFDNLESKLRAAAPDHEYFDTVGAPVVRGTKVKHRIPMGSLNQVTEQDEIDLWGKLVSSTSRLIVTSKLDGNSIAVYYDEEGNFESAVTRGDGFEGLDVTRHVRRMLQRPLPPVPAKALPNLSVRLEAIFKKSLFEAHVTGYKNPRNYVAGQLNRTVADDAFIRYVDLVAFDADITGTKQEVLVALRSSGFTIVEYDLFVTPEDILNKDVLTQLLSQHKESAEYELDGLVIDINEYETRKQLGFDSSTNPRFAAKFKINQNFVETTVAGVEWNPSKDGYLKPRVQFEPIDLAGATISFATGFNAAFIRNNGIGPGAVIRVTRSGDVIPFIESVITPSPLPTAEYMPSEDLFGTFKWSDTDVDIILDELPDESRILTTVEFFRGIDAPLLKEGNITALYEAGFTTIHSIITASEEDLTVVLGENGTKIYVGLRDKLTNIEEYVLAGALPFFGRGVGQRKLKKLAEAYGDLTKLTYDDIIKVPGFEEKTAVKIANAVPLYVDFLADISEYVSIKKLEKVDGDLNGVAVAFTGVRNKDLEKNIESRGGKVLTAVSKEATHLVAKDPAGKSTKLDKARKAGVSIISMDEAIKLWS